MKKTSPTVLYHYMYMYLNYCTIQLVIYLSCAAIYYMCFTLDLFQNTTITVNTQHCEGWGRPECDGIHLCIQYLMLLLYHTSLIPRLHPLWCILAREKAWSLISRECGLISKWISEHGLDKLHTHNIWYLSHSGVEGLGTRLLSTVVCRFNGLTLAVMETQLNLLCSNTMCRPEAKLRSQAALQNYFLYSHFRPGQGSLMPFCQCNMVNCVCADGHWIWENACRTNLCVRVLVFSTVRVCQWEGGAWGRGYVCHTYVGSLGWCANMH